jgi:hypothetical protein
MLTPGRGRSSQPQLGDTAASANPVISVRMGAMLVNTANTPAQPSTVVRSPRRAGRRASIRRSLSPTLIPPLRSLDHRSAGMFRRRHSQALRAKTGAPVHAHVRMDEAIVRADNIGRAQAPEAGRGDVPGLPCDTLAVGDPGALRAQASTDDRCVFEA